ncbi:Jasmonate-zim-domain protein 12 [Heracleum sosnowskyi]|uniref:Protein TIFY n=1 Tax=Heracleum sosnowskyi TaxID=360622 RepID=A0AAD8HVJ3_9APIA|nr:Jasmonate-zim-domain protein 12 [Heracleum sosnowskyi]
MSQIISSASKDCIRSQKYDLSDNMSIYDNPKEVPSDESNLGLFRKFVLNSGQPSKGKRAEEELSESIKNQLRFSGMHPQQFAYTSRPSTLLEKRLLPAHESGAKFPTSSGESKTSKPQLTIFYNGTINVYDNVSVDQAQAIFLLAGGATVSPPVVTNTPKADLAKPQKVHQPDTTLSICKLQTADLPLARTISLQHFLEKRRRRIMNKSPYPAPSSSTTRPDVDKEITQTELKLNNIGESNSEKSFSNSPFPSRGYFFPISSNRRC